MIELKAIIKDKKKYKLIKIPEGLSLNDCETERRTGSTGVATERFGHKWFITPRGKVIFKTYDINEDGLRIVNELLYDELAKQIGLPVAKYIPAQYKSYPLSYILRVDKDEIPKPEPLRTHYGLASVNVTGKNESIYTGEELLDYDDFFGLETFVDYMQALDNFKEGEGYYVDKRNIKSQLYKMMVLDSLTFMEDRHCMNVIFLKNDKDGYLVAAPVIDNEMCFAGKYLWFKDYGEYKNLNLTKFMAAHGNEMCMYVNNDVKHAPREKRYEENVKALVKLSDKSKNMREFLDKTLETIDIDKAFENVEKMGYKVSIAYKNFVKNLMLISTDTFKKHIMQSTEQKQTETKDELTK